MKEAGLKHWISPNTGATNSSGFTGLPGGYRYPQGGWSNYPLGQYGSWWSATESGTNAAWGRMLDAFHFSITIGLYDKHDGFSVRCIRD